MILLVDNYDSFVHNLARYFVRLGQETHVVRNDAISIAQVRELSPAAIVLSPGPCSPAEAGSCVEIVREFWQTIPILGVCLGHQAIAAAFSAKVDRAREPWHGRSSAIVHTGDGIFNELPNPLVVGRYHSLTIVESTLPLELRITARTTAGEIMAIQHFEHPVIGVQFHPESVLTECGSNMLANFLRMSGLEVSACVGPPEVAEQPSAPPRANVGGTPVSF